MSLIPMSAVHAVFTPVQRAANELIRAQQVQAEKASHHSEDVEGLDETAVNSVEERKQGGGRKEDGKRKEPKETVEIANLEEGAEAAAKLGESESHLDISA